MLRQYRNWKPSQFDTAGLGLSDRQDWYVAAVSHTRDSDHLTESNWVAQLSTLNEIDAEGSDFEIHRFGHWACGWLEIIVVRPESQCATKCEEIAAFLNDYPVLDSDDFTEREWTAYLEFWSSGDAQRELVRQLRQQWELPHTLELIESGDHYAVQMWFEDLIPSGDYYDEQCYPRLRYVVQKVTNSDLLRLVRELRKSVSAG